MITVDAVVERKHASLPRYVVVPGDAVAAWKLCGTTVVEVEIDGILLGRRSLKPWGGGRGVWFLDLTEEQCRRAGVDTGDRVRLGLRRASTELPQELAALLSRNREAARKWAALTEAQRRTAAEHVRVAKRPETRARRAARALGLSCRPQSG